MSMSPKEKHSHDLLEMLLRLEKLEREAYRLAVEVGNVMSCCRTLFTAARNKKRTKP